MVQFVPLLLYLLPTSALPSQLLERPPAFVLERGLRPLGEL
jgi:hypothetical protein